MNEKGNFSVYQIIISIAGLLAIILLVSLTAPSTPDNTQNGTSTIQTITAAHTFKDGMHIYRGTIDLPTPCHNLETDAIVRESFPEQVTLQFTVAIPDDAERRFCTQVIDPRPFEIRFQASEQAVVDATVNGRSVELEVTEQTKENSATSTLIQRNSTSSGQ